MLLAKYFIFRSKCLYQILVITVFHTYVKNRMVVEEVIATNNKLNIYNAKWQVYKQTFPWVLTCILNRKHLLFSTIFLSFYTITAPLSPFSNFPTATTSYLKTLWKSACFVLIHDYYFYVLCTSTMNISYWMWCTVFQRNWKLKTQTIW